MASLAIKRHRVLTPQPAVNGPDKCVGKIGTSLVLVEGRPGFWMILDFELRGAKDFFQRESHLIPRVIAGALQYPDHFAQDDAVDQARDVFRAFLSNKSARFPGLIGIVAYEIADQNIGIDAFHRRAARLRIAASISSNEARFGAGASKL